MENVTCFTLHLAPHTSLPTQTAQEPLLRERGARMETQVTACVKTMCSLRHISVHCLYDRLGKQV